MSDDIAVLAINEAFYDAFNRRDMGAIENIWAPGDLTCIHPGWDALRGRDEVLSSFRAILEGRGSPRIRCVEPSVHVLGDTAVVICTEAMAEREQGTQREPRDDGPLLVATNLYVRVTGRWRMVHHHAGPVSARRPPRSSSPPPKRSDLN